MKRLKKVLSEILKIDKSEITDNTSPMNVKTWDSLNGLLIVVGLEKEFNVKFTLEEIDSVRNTRDIKENLKKHGVELHG